MKRIEIGPEKTRTKIKKESSIKEEDSNLEVKFAMAKELLSMGLHIRSVERLLNVRLDSIKEINADKKGNNHGL